MPDAPLVNLKLSQDEVRILHQALNEICNGLDIPEFHPRMGVHKSEVLDLMERLAMTLS
jgi:hypothetical protein